MASDKFTLNLLLGAGASKPLGIPVSQEIVEQIFDRDFAAPLSDLKGKILAENWDIEKVIRLIRSISSLGIDPPLERLLGECYDDDVKERVEILRDDYSVLNDSLIDYIRNVCLNPDIDKAVEIYGPLLQLSDDIIIKIFTTNYDIAIEEVCKKLKLDYNDGYSFSRFDDYKKFSPEILGVENIQLYKLHGSVNWWTDNKHQELFKLGIELKGIPDYQTMMIYPAELESTFNYPFNILQSHYILSLMSADFILAIGHKFGDINISMPIQALLEKPNFDLTIVNPSAEKLKKDFFKEHKSVNPIDQGIESWLPKEGIELIKKKVEEHNKNIKEEEEKRKKEREQYIKQGRERAREEQERQQTSPYGITINPISTLHSEPTLLTTHSYFCPECKTRSDYTTCQKCGNKTIWDPFQALK